MAPKASSKPKGEGKQGLVVALVFFILATIGLGISTYTGYTADEGKDKKIKDLEGTVKLREKDRDWFKFQALLFQAYIGVLKVEDLKDLALKKKDFDGNSLGDEKEREPLRVIVKQTLEPRFKWDPAQEKFDKTYEALLVEDRNRYDALKNQVDGLIKEKTQAEARAKAAEDLAKAVEDNYKVKFDEQNKKVATDNTDLLKKIEEFKAEAESQSKKLEDVQKTAAKERAGADAKAAKLTKDLRDLNTLLKQRDEVLEQIQQKGRDVPKDWRTDWKIVNIDTKGDTVYINLGSADKVVEQLTFSVHGLGTDRKPIPVAKGSMEVINVVGPHLSQARITGVKDRFRDPILKGDILFNPSWDPTLKKHVAIAGIIDLTGEGRDNIAEFMRNLEKQNIIVDAWLDMKDMTIKGKGITVQTDYLILGNGLDYISDRPENKDFRDKLDRGMSDMQAEAKSKGVWPPMGLHKYLEMIGYQRPRAVSDRPPAYRPTYQPGAAPANAKDPKPPLDPKEPMKKEEKPPAEDKGM